MKENPLNLVDDDWAALVKTHFDALPLKALPVEGAIVSGAVIANAPFGIYLDVGCGRPALLEVMYVPDSPDNGTLPHWTKPHGTLLTVRVSYVDDDVVHVDQWGYETWNLPRA